MKKALKLISLVFVCVLFVGIQYADAQRRGERRTNDDQYFDESGGFAHRLYYGGMVNFSLAGGNFGNSLLMGVSPMVGFKINEIFSVGPRAQLDYLIFYIPGPNEKYLLWGIGGFGRAKLFNNIFAHTEYSFEAVSYISGEQDQRVDSGTNFYLGGGYNSSITAGGGFGYEILVLYNFLEDNEFQVPIDYRIGFTWNF